MAESRDDLPLEELREAWRAARPRSHDADAGDGQEPQDASTRAVVDWMRAAWGTLEASAAPVPRVPPPSTGRLLALPRRRWRVAAALAAGLLAVAAVGAFLQRSGDGVRPEDEHAPRVADAGPPASAGSPADGPQVVSLGPDHLEMRSGPVRLILFQEPTVEN